MLRVMQSQMVGFRQIIILHRSMFMEWFTFLEYLMIFQGQIQTLNGSASKIIHTTFIYLCRLQFCAIKPKGKSMTHRILIP